jgi:type II secretion system protein N
MSVTAKRSLFAAYLLAVTLALLWVCFPSEAVRTHAAARLAAALPGLTVAVGAARPSLPPGILLQDLRISHADRPLAVIEQVRIVPEWFSLFAEQAVYAFSGTAADGSISGTSRVAETGTGPKESLEAHIAGLQLRKMPALQDVYGSRLSGRLEGTLSGNPGALKGKITVSDLQLELAAPVFELKTFAFRTLEAEITLQPKSLVLRSCRLRGNEMDAEVSGTIALEAPGGKNALNLSGRVTPHHGFLAKMEGSLPSNFLRRRGGLGFKVGGSLEAPGFSLN